MMIRELLQNGGGGPVAARTRQDRAAASGGGGERPETSHRTDRPAAPAAADMMRPVRHCRSGPATSSDSADSGGPIDDELLSAPAQPSNGHDRPLKTLHTPEDPKLKPRHPCSVCHQLFALRSTWHEHMREAHGITKPFDCDECGKRYSMLGALNYHRLTTHRGVVHACKTCGKRFMTKPGLVRHARSHFGGVYVCEDCEKTYPTRDSLRRHRQQVHMGEKPHVCQYCQERFGASHSLNRHVKRRHSTGPAAAPAPPTASEHNCQLCLKPFSSAEALRKHVQSMHRHAQYQCETCLRRFYDLSNYTRHRDAKSCVAAVSVDLQEAPTISVVAAPAASVVTGVTAVTAVTGVSGETIKLEPVKLEPLQPLEPAPAGSEQADPAAAAAAAEMELDADETNEFAAASAEDEFAEFARRYGEAAPAGDHVELQPVDAVELHALEPAVPAELPAAEAAAVAVEQPTVLLPLTLAEPLVAGGQDVYVTLYPAGESNGHRFVCLQDGESTVFAEAPLIAEHVLNVN
ncbi:zinc finger protein 764-like isoform X1 [Amphibalanus amphitrite]|uniref:zinc finger protein 764-like isoform X1 n=2 Tax=Amphibalanus amphitrite TaxID=1232801 RepID=UPI001C924064|nr:zinc finger protein 764-like isoform X1 [Amphibalanus amphitrite]